MGGSGSAGAAKETEAGGFLDVVAGICWIGEREDDAAAFERGGCLLGWPFPEPDGGFWFWVWRGAVRKVRYCVSGSFMMRYRICAREGEEEGKRDGVINREVNRAKRMWSPS